MTNDAPARPVNVRTRITTNDDTEAASSKETTVEMGTMSFKNDDSIHTSTDIEAKRQG